MSFNTRQNPSLVLVQPKKTRPYIAERLLMGGKESNQTNTHPTVQEVFHVYLNKFENVVTHLYLVIFGNI